MSYEAWPSPDSPRGPLPRIDDLPIAEQGYEQEAVREAFDRFYRHAAQLDASLKALEAVEVFRRDAMELRNDLRSIRSLGFGGAEQSWSPAQWTTYEQPRRELPAAVPRLAAEASLVIAVAVIAGVAHFRAWVIVALMAAAWAIVAVSEWLAARARTRVPSAFYEPLPVDEHLEPAPYVETPAVGWSAFEPAAPEPEAEPQAEAEELTMVEPSPVEEASVEAAAKPSGHVRVLPAPAAEADPWERGFDGEEPEPEPAPGPEAEPEPEPAAAAEPEPSGFGRIRRRRR